MIEPNDPEPFIQTILSEDVNAFIELFKEISDQSYQGIRLFEYIGYQIKEDIECHEVDFMP